MEKKWEYVPFENVVEICDSLRKPINNKERSKRISGKTKSELYPYYGATGQVGFIDDYIIEGEYVLLGEDGAPFLNAFGQKAYIISGKTWVNNHAHILKSKTNNKFLCYYLNSFNYKGFVSGTTRLKLTQAQMKNIRIPNPSVTEQERIVARIEELFSELDEAVTTLNKTKEQLEIYRQAVLKEAFEGKWNLGIVDELGENKEFKEVSREETEKLISLPDGWKYVYLSDLGELSRGKSKHRPRNDARLFENGKYPFFQTGEIKSAQKYVVECEKKYGEFGLQQSKLWPAGTLCITIAANIAETCFLGIDACFPDSIVGFLPNEKIINQEYVRYFIEASKARLWVFAPATAQKNINLTTLENLVVPYCSLREQEKIVENIEVRMTMYYKIMETIKNVILQAEAMHQSILKEAFEGRLVL